jgi:hypothetical protein
MPPLWHVSDFALSIGDVVPAGTFGEASISGGAEGPWYFFRECMIELVRATRALGAVSRLECAFAFESRQIAIFLAATSNQSCFRVEPVDSAAPISRHDMAWIDWIGKPGTSPSDVVDAIERYWDGAPIETGEKSRWEWLSSSGLEVIGTA